MIGLPHPAAKRRPKQNPGSGRNRGNQMTLSAKSTGIASL
ncbi:Uncharacterised protein [Bordetella pertussis]|nr:Uncharacterised protein [Bordetella pertussis]